MRSTEAVGETLRRLGVDTFFGLMGRGNMGLVLQMAGPSRMRYVAARHETSAVSMADAYARATGRVGVATTTLGPGISNATNGLLEAARGRTPLVVLTGDHASGHRRGGQFLDQTQFCAGLGIEVMPVATASSAVDDVVRAFRSAIESRAPIVVPVSLDVQSASADHDVAAVTPVERPWCAGAGPVEVAAAVAALRAAEFPLVLAGRGALVDEAAESIEALASRLGALVGTTLPASGLFAGAPYSVGTVGVHSSPTAVDLLAGVDIVVAFGCSLNRFTTRAGHLFSSVRSFVHCDRSPEVFGAVPDTIALHGGADETARSLFEALGPAEGGGRSRGFRNQEVAERLLIARRSSPVPDASPGRFVDPERVLRWIDARIPANRTVVREPGHASGIALGVLSVGGPRAAVDLFDYESIGLGLAAAAGAAAAHPDRVTVLVLGDGGMLMSLGELETLVRYRLRVLVVVLNDAAYGAEVRELEMRGLPIDTASFTASDITAVARALGADATTIRTVDDLLPLDDWLADPSGPHVLDCKIDRRVAAEWFVNALGDPNGYLRRPRPGF